MVACDLEYLARQVQGVCVAADRRASQAGKCIFADEDAGTIRGRIVKDLAVLEFNGAREDCEATTYVRHVPVDLAISEQRRWG